MKASGEAAGPGIWEEERRSGDEKCCRIAKLGTIHRDRALGLLLRPPASLVPTDLNRQVGNGRYLPLE